MQAFWANYTKVATIPYSQFEKLLNGDKIAKVTVSQNAVQGTLKEALQDGKKAVLHRPRRS